MMNSSSRIELQAAPDPLWRELWGIFLFYLKIFFITVLFGSVFFSLYAGIKTSRIPLDFVAIVLSVLGSSIAGIITFYYLGRLKAVRTKLLDLDLLAREHMELERLGSEIKQLDLKLKEDILNFGAESGVKAGPDMESRAMPGTQILNDIDRIKVGLLVRSIEPAPSILRTLLFEVFRLTIIISMGLPSIIQSERIEREKEIT